MAIHKAKVFTVTSMKGGVGKSTFTLQLAHAFEQLKKQVLIIDLDLHSGVIAPMLNIDNTNDICKLIDDLNNNRFKSLDNYIVKYNTYLDVLAAPKDPRSANKVSMKYLNILLNKATIKYDLILIDTNHIIDEINLVAFDNSDEMIYIVSNDAMDFKNMRTMISIFKDMEKNNFKIILNNAFKKQKSYYNLSDVKNLIKHNVDYVLPSDLYIKNIDKYVIDGKIPVVSKKKISKFSTIAQNLLKEKRN